MRPCIQHFVGRELAGRFEDKTSRKNRYSQIPIPDCKQAMAPIIDDELRLVSDVQSQKMAALKKDDRLKNLQ